MRELQETELDLVAGGNAWQLTTVTVTGRRWLSGWQQSIGSIPDTSEYDTEPQPPQPAEEPDCNVADPIGMLTAPDGAKYYVPEGITPKYLLDAIAHLNSFITPESKMLAFFSMYNNPQDPYFVDFKDWGNDNGPPGSVSGGVVTYWSDAVGDYVTGSPFEPFGNYFYGFLGVLGGIPAEVLSYSAGLFQTGNDVRERLLGTDGPQDKPHVDKGIADALHLAALQQLGTQQTVFSVNNGTCSTGHTTGYV